MSARMTCAPCCAKSRAICSPMPDPAPVTKAIFLSKRNTHVSFLHVLRSILTGSQSILIFWGELISIHDKFQTGLTTRSILTILIVCLSQGASLAHMRSFVQYHESMHWLCPLLPDA